MNEESKIAEAKNTKRHVCQRIKKYKKKRRKSHKVLITDAVYLPLCCCDFYVNVTQTLVFKKKGQILHANLYEIRTRRSYFNRLCSSVEK
jgi:hypothetical protein